MYLPLEIIDIIITFLTTEEMFRKIMKINSVWRSRVNFGTDIDLSWVCNLKNPLKIIKEISKENINKLTINKRYVNANLMSAILKRFDKISFLNLEGISTYHSSYYNINKLSNLRTLNLKSSNISNFNIAMLMYNKELEELNISDNKINDFSIIMILKHCLKIKIIYLPINSNLSIDNLFYIMSLKKITIKFC